MSIALHSLHFQILYIQEKSMNQTVYILILISLVVLFLFNKYEREKLQRLLQEQLLK
ncbi:MAG: MarR family transcriptional regulator, partial [Streptococcus salivarius]